MCCTPHPYFHLPLSRLPPSTTLPQSAAPFQAQPSQQSRRPIAAAGATAAGYPPPAARHAHAGVSRALSSPPLQPVAATTHPPVAAIMQQ